jgi:hypothetical protein
MRRQHSPKWRAVYKQRKKINPRFADKITLSMKATGMQMLSRVTKGYSCHMLYNQRNDSQMDYRSERSWKEYRKTQWK